MMDVNSGEKCCGAFKLERTYNEKILLSMNRSGEENMYERKYIIAGRVIPQELLGEDIDHQFYNLHSAFFSNQSIDLTEFEKAAMGFFDANPRPMPSSIHNSYFHNFTPIWHHFLSTRNYVEAEEIWDIALAPVLKWEKTHPTGRIHKGTAFYFWGMTALEHGDLDKGYFLMHQSVEEDVFTQQEEHPNISGLPDSPSLALATLNYAKLDQAYRIWVTKQAQFVIEQLSKYSSQYSRIFSIDDFRLKFLLNPPSVDIIFIFAFALARINKLYSFPPYITKSRFAGQLQANALFDIVLVIDALIKQKSPNKRDFKVLAKFLSDKTGQPLSELELGEINGNFNDHFDNTLDSAISGTLLLPSGKQLTRLQFEIAVVYGLRNHIAHDISSVPTILKRYKEIVQIVMNILFASVDYLY
jgi:hypothetical protein